MRKQPGANETITTIDRVPRPANFHNDRLAVLPDYDRKGFLWATIAPIVMTYTSRNRPAMVTGSRPPYCHATAAACQPPTSSSVLS